MPLFLVLPVGIFAIEGVVIDIAVATICSLRSSGHGRNCRRLSTALVAMHLGHELEDVAVARDIAVNARDDVVKMSFLELGRHQDK